MRIRTDKNRYADGKRYITAGKWYEVIAGDTTGGYFKDDTGYRCYARFACSAHLDEGAWDVEE